VHVPRSGATARAWGFAIVAAACAVASLLLSFRPFVLSGGDLLNGGPGDTRLQIAILDHWLAVLAGRAAMTSPTFFFPARHVLGYSDALVLYVPPYAIARVAGFDRYLAFAATLVVVKAVGFVAMVAFLRRTLRVDRWLALLGGVLFTVSNAYFLAAGHGQFAAVAFLPLLAVLAGAYWRHRVAGRTRPARTALVAAAVLLGLVLFTAFYVGWFALFIGGVAAVVALPWVIAEVRRVGPTAVLTDGGLFLTALLVTLVPFAITYFPVLRQNGGRSFAEVGLFTQWIRDAVNVGPDNLVWGGVLARVLPPPTRDSAFSLYETQRGWPPILLGIFLATAAAAVWQVRGGDLAPAARLPPRTTALLAVATLVAWASSLEVAGLTPWAVVHRLVPGASAIRVPVRLNFALNVLVVAIAMVGLGELTARTAAGHARTTALGLAVVALILVLEQLNLAEPFALSRGRERELLAAVPPIPPSCRAFYVVRSPTDDPMAAVETQTFAMLVSADTGVPTINGYSGNVPRRWRMFLFDADYPRHVETWVRAHRLRRGLCALDLDRRSWSPPVVQPAP
jgi:hypothetical protein